MRDCKGLIKMILRDKSGIIAPFYPMVGSVHGAIQELPAMLQCSRDIKPGPFFFLPLAAEDNASVMQRDGRKKAIGLFGREPMLNSQLPRRRQRVEQLPCHQSIPKCACISVAL